MSYFYSTIGLEVTFGTRDCRTANPKRPALLAAELAFEVCGKKNNFVYLIMKKENEDETLIKIESVLSIYIMKHMNLKT